MQADRAISITREEVVRGPNLPSLPLLNGTELLDFSKPSYYEFYLYNQPLVRTMCLLISLSAGVIFPSLTQLWSRWAPAADRSILIGFAVSGSHLGSVFCYAIGGHLCHKGIGFGPSWAALFYLNAMLTFTWCILWVVLFRTDPQKHPFVSQKEKDYILRNTVPRRPISFRKIPWLKILKSRAFIAHDAYHTLVNWGFYIMLTNTPTYMKHVLKFDIKETGFISCIPFLLIWLTTTSSGLVADVLISRQILSRTAVRKLANSIGAFGPGIMTIAIGFAKSTEVAVALYSISGALFGVTFGAGFMCVCNDIGGSIAGIVFGMANAIGSIPGIIAPYVTSAMTKQHTQAQWRNVFIIAGVMYFIAGIEFLFFGTALPQFYMEEEEIRDPTSKKDMSADRKMQEAQDLTNKARKKIKKQKMKDDVTMLDDLPKFEDIEVEDQFDDSDDSDDNEEGHIRIPINDGPTI
ncbi:hypothetical protein ACOME3_002049 [Neoechinorhynchus agilis]